jgi:hypothetical protein
MSEENFSLDLIFTEEFERNSLTDFTDAAEAKRVREKSSTLQIRLFDVEQSFFHFFSLSLSLTLKIPTLP